MATNVADPMLETVLLLLDTVVKHGCAEHAQSAAHYHQLLLDNPVQAIGTGPMADLDGTGKTPRLLLLGASLYYKHYSVTPSLKASFFAPVWLAQTMLTRMCIFTHTITYPTVKCKSCCIDKDLNFLPLRKLHVK